MGGEIRKLGLDTHVLSLVINYNYYKKSCFRLSHAQTQFRLSLVEEEHPMIHFCTFYGYGIRRGNFSCNFSIFLHILRHQSTHLIFDSDFHEIGQMHRQRQNNNKEIK